MSRRFRAPTAHGEVLADPPFEALPALVEANRRLLDRTDVTIGGLPLRDLRKLARREALGLVDDVSREPKASASPGAPLLLTGHQPELSHPGVWVKNFALNGLARKLGGVPLHLIVDNDTLKSTTIRVPVFREGDPASVRQESVAFDTFDGEVPYEDRAVQDAALFGAFADRFLGVRANNIGEAFTAARRARERAWGCDNRELPVSRLSQTKAFQLFAAELIDNRTRFRAAYNAAIRAYRAVNGVRSAHHPAPELAEDEVPLWEQMPGGRRRLRGVTMDITPNRLRPRALTLTLFARVCLGDFFIHGIGGGKYDEVTDAIIRDYFGIEPPSYQVLSATLHLPLPTFPSTAADLDRAKRRVRDLRWNPQVALPPGALTEAHAALAANEPPRGDHAARREWFRELQAIKEQMRVQVAGEVPGEEAELARVRSEVAANAILRRRDYPWVLYPEAMLRAFFRGFL
ncbi:MAG: hypothetical protein FJ304_11265 [Planctomycetes bacterium]|nr:hypothetical protein [Planctomycetota bacterium]